MERREGVVFCRLSSSLIKVGAIPQMYWCVKKGNLEFSPGGNGKPVEKVEDGRVVMFVHSHQDLSCKIVFCCILSPRRNSPHGVQEQRQSRRSQVRDCF